MSRRPRTLVLNWDGEVFRPAPAFLAYCNREYVVGETYHLAPVEERSQASHRQYFAAVAEGFNNLNEESAKRFPSSEHLRKWALVQCGYCIRADYPLKNEKEARKLAADIRDLDEYAVIKPDGDVVTVWRAQSQSMAAMKKDNFEKSKRDVLDLISAMARTTTATLYKEGRRNGR